MTPVQRVILTIGHSNHSLDTFLTFLRQQSVTLLADVRSTPFSRFNPQFNREALERSLETHGIKYAFLGNELGGRSDDPSCYESGRVQYALIAHTNLFHKGIEQVMRDAIEHRVVLMCAEKEPLECHRTLLVARALEKLGVTVEHILADGGLESNSATMERLLDLLGLPHQDLFLSKEQLIEDALARQEARIAYVNEKLVIDARKENQ